MAEEWVSDDPPRRFTDLAAASEFLERAFPGNELRMSAWWVVVWGGFEVARLVDDGHE